MEDAGFQSSPFLSRSSTKGKRLGCVLLSTTFPRVHAILCPSGVQAGRSRLSGKIGHITPSGRFRNASEDGT